MRRRWRCFLWTAFCPYVRPLPWDVSHLEAEHFVAHGLCSIGGSVSKRGSLCEQQSRTLFYLPFQGAGGRRVPPLRGTLDELGQRSGVCAAFRSAHAPRTKAAFFCALEECCRCSLHRPLCAVTGCERPHGTSTLAPCFRGHASSRVAAPCVKTWMGNFFQEDGLMAPSPDLRRLTGAVSPPDEPRAEAKTLRGRPGQCLADSAQRAMPAAGIRIASDLAPGQPGMPFGR